VWDETARARLSPRQRRLTIPPFSYDANLKEDRRPV